MSVWEDLPVYCYSPTVLGVVVAFFKMDGVPLALVGHRMMQGNVCQRLAGRLLRKIVHITYGIEIHPSAEIGTHFYVGHIGHVVIGEKVKIGNNCTILHFFTLGAAGSGARRGYPQLGDNVYVGAHAVVIGDITIGNHVTIGAASVVTKSMPDYAVCAGNPARILRIKLPKETPSCVE